MNESNLTKEEVLKRLEDEWDFEKLLEPYREGGTESDPVRRTWGTVVDWLLNKRHFPPEVIGASIFLVWMKVKKDGHFSGTGEYGSAGNEFVQSLRVVCASLMQQKMSQQIFSGMAGKIEEQIKIAFREDFWAFMPVFVKWFSLKFWKFKVQKRRLKKQRG